MSSGATQKRSKSQLDALIDRAFEENGSVIIKRPGHADLALIPAEKLRYLDTTDYLLSSPKNRRRLQTAIRDARAGKGKAINVRQLRKNAGLD